MKGRMSRVAAGLLVGAALSACDDQTVSEITYSEVKAAAEGGDAAAVGDRFETFKSKRVRWQGQVVQATKQFEDDYVEVGLLLVDFDPQAGAADPAGTPEDAVTRLKPSQLDGLAAGKPVTLTAVIREYTLKDGKLLLSLETKALE